MPAPPDPPPRASNGPPTPPDAPRPRAPDRPMLVPWQPVDAPAALVGGAAAVAAGGLLATPLGRALWWSRGLPAMPGYSRLARDEVLDQGTRMRVYTAIEHNPGITFTRLRRTLGLSTGVLYHHLRMLERHDLVRSRRLGVHRAFHRTGTPPAEIAAPLTSAQSRVLAELALVGVADRSTLAARLGVSPQNVSHHTKRLAERGLLSIELRGGQLFYRPGPEPGSASAAPADPA